MVLLSLLGLAAGAAIVNSAAKQHGKKANPKLDTTRFDADNAEYGIAHGGFTEEKIINIAARCGVKPNKDGVLPENGWKHCLKYVSNYVNAPEDIDNFKSNWLLIVKSQLDSKSRMLINKHWDAYQRQYKGYLENKENWTSGPKIVLEFKHWHGLPKDEHIQRLKDLQTKTFWGELALKDPILRHNPRFENSFIEVWIMQGHKNDRQGSWLTNKTFDKLYEDCLGICGYDAML